MQITHLTHNGYEQVVKFTDHDFLCYIAIHSTKLGPSLGGCRIKSYDSEDAALLDVLRLSKGMTYKSSLAGLNLGGAKCVVVADRPTRDIMLKVGEAVNYFNGQYITAEDIGTKLSDIQIVGEVSPHIAHLDGSANTARGVLSCMKVAASFKENDELQNLKIWVQGLGKVGYDLFARLVEENNDWVTLGAPNVYVSDPFAASMVNQAISLHASVISEAIKPSIDIYSPCAMGQVVTYENVDTIKYSIICGSANNQLEDDSLAAILYKNGVLYCPDFLVNSGGIITGAGEIEGWTTKEVEDRCDAIGETLLHVFNMAADKTILTPMAAAKIIAEDRLK